MYWKVIVGIYSNDKMYGILFVLNNYISFCKFYTIKYYVIKRIFNTLSKNIIIFYDNSNLLCV